VIAELCRKEEDMEEKEEEFGKEDEDVEHDDGIIVK